MNVIASFRQINRIKKGFVDENRILVVGHVENKKSLVYE